MHFVSCQAVKNVSPVWSRHSGEGGKLNFTLDISLTELQGKVEYFCLRISVNYEIRIVTCERRGFRAGGL